MSDDKRSEAVSRGECRACSRTLQLRKDGSVWTHRSDREPLMNCRGSGLRPAGAVDLMAALRATSVDAAKSTRVGEDPE